ncbi:sensor histidine kinase [Paenibacillus radicis (ex Gao et al. 2016)]|uniref:Heme sensor protein HssS n=1 Tax=Paenibacillus radicis (ex Gao et al. 2016) TaxID=1737354 RepID=A0A917HG56_9BACL|nr:HAMP domain-containing sensor histidine kinase [Paenibacillus radicis (ex Gao et al. 2016)]GGG77972.1 two-component sensor histidine kinase [Paenibacillus radicis (ex Gao et al. 2016)]
MIRSLYVRITITFLIIVLVSMGIAFFMANLLFQRDMKGKFGGSMEHTIDRIEQLYTGSAPRSLPVFLEQVANLQGLTLVAVGRNGMLISVGLNRDSLVNHLTRETLTSVFAGQTVQVAIGEEGEDKPSKPPAIGRTVRFGNMDWALFVTPDRAMEVRSFQRNTFTILTTVLVVGGILILVAARYLVKPLKMMTAATTRIAKGDFDVQLPLQRGDELGELADSINRMAVGLSQLEMMRQDFVSNVSHEIQSPLTSIGGFAEALRSEQLTEAERGRYVGIIKQESSRLSRLSENLLKLASLDSQQHPYAPAPYRLDRQLRDTVLSCEPHWVAKQQTVELFLEETIITADEDQLSQVWINLLTNSMKFTPEGGHISFHLTEHEGFAIVRIADSGSGIPPEDRERVFERFYKSDASRDRTLGGSGLGLSIVHKIVGIHGGTIEIEEGEGEGAVFIVRLPVAL